LQNITSIGSELWITDNPMLENIEALAYISLAIYYDLYIINNPTLSQCDIDNICDYLINPSGTVEIYDNAIGCNSPEEVEEACEVLSCLPEGITFTTQAQIDNFQINHPNCTEIEGDVTIQGDEITNLNGLSVLTSIGGDLSIYQDYALTSLFGLENLASIGGDLDILFNDALTSLSGLQGLTSVEGYLQIHFNNVLETLEGLNNIQSISGNLYIVANDSLNSLSGLNNLTTIGGNLQIGDWIDFGLGGFTPVGNKSLANLSGLENLTSIGGFIEIVGNENMTDLTGMGNVETVNGSLFIDANESLTTLHGLENITNITGSLWIGGYHGNSGNESLLSLSELTNLVFIGDDLEIINNYSLSMCAIDAVCDYLSTPNGNISISNNALGCASQQQVQDSCDVIPYVENRTIHQGLTISPNPLNDYAMLSLNLSTPAPVEICIYNLTGICAKSWEYQAEAPGEHAYYLNLAELVPGVYFCKVLMGDRVVVEKIIKQ